MNIDPKFFDYEIYAIYKAVNEVLGRETWSIVWRSGEILLDLIWDELGLKLDMDYIEALKRVAEWLKKVGYIDEIELIKEDEGNIRYVMKEPVIADGAKKLIDEGYVPPHISTSLLFATLKRFGYKVEMVGDPIFMGDKVVEKWRLVPIMD